MSLRLVCLGAALLLGAGLPACGGDSDPKQPATVTQTVSTPTSTSTSTPTAPQTSPTESGPGSTPTRTEPTTTPSAPAPRAAARQCGSVGGGFVSHITIVGDKCPGARFAAQDWLRRIQAGDNPRGPVTALTFRCRAAFAGEAARVRCVNQIDRHVVLTFRASP